MIDRKYYYTSIILVLTCITAFCQQWHTVPNSNAINSVGVGDGQDVRSLKIVNGDLIIGGDFWTSSAHVSAAIEKYNVKNNLWGYFSSGLIGSLYTIEEYNGEIYAGGALQGVPAGGSPPYQPHTKGLAKWTGAAWISVDTASPIDGSYLYAIKKYGTDIYFGGDPYNNSYHFIAKYSGGTKWDNMLGGVDGFPGRVFAMTVYKGNLIVGGGFLNAGNGSINTAYIARWDGAKWDSLGSGLDGNVGSFAIDTVTNTLYVGGGFTMAGGVPVRYIAKWDGTAWSAVAPLPTVEGPQALKMFNGKLYAGLRGTTGSPTDTTLIYLDGTGWHPVFGPNEAIFALEVYNGNLYAGGAFSKIDTTTVNYIACYGDSCPGTPITITLPYSVNDLNKSVRFKVYPNPAKAELNIQVEGNEAEEYIVKMYNTAGSEITSQKFLKQIKISTLNFSKGLYQVEVCDMQKKTCHAEKIILQ